MKQVSFTYRVFLKERTYAVSTPNMSFSAEADSPLKPEQILAFSSVLTVPIVHTVSG